MINNFGDEDKSFLTNFDYRNIIISHYRGIVRLVKLIYFNPNLPNNHTLKYDPIDERYLLVYDSGIFQPLIKEYVLDSIIIDAWARLVNYFDMIEATGRRSVFKESLASEETLERIDAFTSDYRRLCQGHAVSMLQDVRNNVYEMIKFHHQVVKKKKKAS